MPMLYDVITVESSKQSRLRDKTIIVQNHMYYKH